MKKSTGRPKLLALRAAALLAVFIVVSEQSMAEEGGWAKESCKIKTDDYSLFRLDADIATWNRSHGYFESGDRVPYQGYSESQLAELSSQGDLLAHQVLYRKGFDAKDRQWGKRRKLLEDAAAFGSTEALVRLSQMVAQRSNAGKSDGRGDIEAVAILDVALRRGDAGAVSALELHLDALNTPLSEKDFSSVLAMSDKLYKKLEGMRQRKGLPAFDNTPLSTARMYVDIFMTKVKDPIAHRIVLRHTHLDVCAGN